MFINSFPSGYISNRNALSEVLDRGMDVLFTGSSNLIHTGRLTWQRRPGFAKWNMTALKPSGFDLYPFRFAYYLDGTTPRVVVQLRGDTGRGIYEVSPIAITLIQSSTTGWPNWFASVRNVLYVTRSGEPGTLPHIKRIAGGAAKLWGMTRPTTVWVDPDNAPSFEIETGGTGLRARSGFRYLWIHKDSSDGHISSASPVSGKTGRFGGGAAKQVHVRLPGTDEARVAKIDLYRTFDGGSDFFFHSSHDNPGLGNVLDIYDQTPDSGLTASIIAPSETSNEPPPIGLTHIVRHADRLWGISEDDDKVYFSAHNIDGLVNGVPEECWPVENSFQFVAPRALASVQQGLLVFCATGEVVLITGTSKFDLIPTPIYAGLPISSPNQIDKDGDVIYMLTDTRQFLRISDRVEDIGDVVSEWDNLTPRDCYVAVLRSGTNGGVYISGDDGSVMRYGFNEGTWSPPWFPAPLASDGVSSSYIGAIAGVMTSLGNWQLLAGPSSVVPAPTGGFLWTLSDTHTDSGVLYGCNATFGSLWLAEPGKLANLHDVSVFSTVQCSSVGVLLGEISGTFSSMGTPVNEPERSSPSSIVAKRYYMKNAGVGEQGQHVQLKLSWSAADDTAELLALNINADEGAV